MQRDLKILILVLASPLILYSTGYAYAATVTSSYVNLGPYIDIAPGETKTQTVACNPGDYVTGGGAVGMYPYLTVVSSYPTIYGGGIGASGYRPTDWTVTWHNSGTITYSTYAFAVCQTPVTVAGVGVPEFASLYMAIALAACIYFALTRIRKPSLK